MFEFKSYSQNDPLWKHKLLGFSQDLTIGKFGCLLTCLSMVSSGYGYDVDPASLNDKLVALGPNAGFQGALVIPASLPRILPRMIYKDFTWCRESPAPMMKIKDAIAAGKSVIIELDYSPATGLQNHWVVLYKKKGNDFLLRDPYPYPSETGEVLLGKSRFSFAGEIENIITAVLFIEGIMPAQPPSPTPVPQAGMEVYAIADGLALRTQPVVLADNLLKRIPLLQKISVIEPESDALYKIGVVNQWINVRDQEGVEGYVAAWYVSTKPEIPPEATPAPTPPPEVKPALADLIVNAAVDGLALRSQPVISDETLIKRLPFDSELLILESPDQARAKIGVEGQWIRVRDIEGSEGIVAAWYVSTTRHPPLGPKPAPAAMIVRSTADGLTLRSQPKIAEENVIKRLPINAEFVVLEPAASAQTKIGIHGQWLKVRDISNTEGYVAAWYVDLRPLSGT